RHAREHAVHLDVPPPEDRRGPITRAQFLLDVRRAHHRRVHLRAGGHPARADPHRAAQGDRRYGDGALELEPDRARGCGGSLTGTASGMIRFSHVTKTYPRTGTAVHDVTFGVGKGEFVFLTVASGAG